MAGVVASSVVESIAVTSAGALPKKTLGRNCRKLSPKLAVRITTFVPPACEPAFGVTSMTRPGCTSTYSKHCVSVADCPESGLWTVMSTEPKSFGGEKTRKSPAPGCAIWATALPKRTSTGSFRKSAENPCVEIVTSSPPAMSPSGGETATSLATGMA